MGEYTIDDMLRVGAAKNLVEAENYRLKRRVEFLEAFLKDHLCESVFCPGCGVDRSPPTQIFPNYPQPHYASCDLFNPDGTFKATP